MKTKYIIGNQNNGLVLYGTGHGYLFLNPEVSDHKPVYFNSHREASDEANRLALYYPPETTQFHVAKVFIFDEPKVLTEIMDQPIILVLNPTLMTDMEMNEALTMFETSERLLNSPVYKN